MTELIHYYAVPSRGMVTHWMLEELGVPYENRLLNLEKEEHKQPDYLAINPMGRVPALVHDGRVVTETAAIVTYLADAFPEAGLNVPLDSPARGDYLRWIFFATASAEPAVMWKALGKVETEIDYRPFATVEDIADTLVSALKDKAFIVDDRFTAADIMLGTTIMWSTQLMPMLPAHPELQAYWEGLSGRPAWQRAWAEDQALMSG